MKMASASGREERSVERDIGATAPGRCVMYAAFSDLLASPFDAVPAVAGGELAIDELRLPYALVGVQALLDEWRDAYLTAPDKLKREYSGLFEVGSNGPPVPIREDLHLNQPAGVREDIVRFYEFFGYGLEEKFAWSPDHLSIELEFMHFLCFREAQSVSDGSDTLSYQLAQRDFSERHLCNWVSALADRAAHNSEEGLYPRLLAGLSQFVVKDFEWQATTIAEHNQ